MIRQALYYTKSDRNAQGASPNHTTPAERNAAAQDADPYNFDRFIGYWYYEMSLILYGL